MEGAKGSRRKAKHIEKIDSSYKKSKKDCRKYTQQKLQYSSSSLRSDSEVMAYKKFDQSTELVMHSTPPKVDSASTQYLKVTPKSFKESLFYFDDSKTLVEVQIKE